MEAENNSASQSGVEKLPNTPDMSAQDAEAMIDSMLRDSPLANLEMGNEAIPEDDGSSKLPKRGEGEKLLEEGSEKQPEKTPTGKLVPPCKEGISLLLLI